MKYASLDLETTGLSPAQENILMLSLVVEDTDKAKDVPVEALPHFTCYIRQKEPFQGEFFALAMNAWILDIIAGRDKISTAAKAYPILTAYPANKTVQGTDANGTPVTSVENLYWVEQCTKFLKYHFGDKRITIAGKNVAGFDIPFMPKEIRSMFKHKALDPATLFIDWATDKDAPGLEECKKRAGIMTPVAHDAREDAMDVIRLLRRFYVK